jgi:GPH family glycoside/pentoside/hexuronide:cation symporter
MTMPAAVHGDRLRPVTKLAYGIGAVGDSIKTFAFTTFLLFYYTTVLGLPGTWLGLAMALGLVWDATIDPLIGHVSDRASFRFGRRHTFMLIGALLAGASLVAVFSPPSGLSAGALFAWLLMSSLCLRSSNSLFMVPYYALGAELATTDHERTSVAAYRAGAVLCGAQLATAAAFLLFLPNEASKFDAQSYGGLGIAFGTAISVVGVMATLGTLRERPRLAAGSDESADRVAFHRVMRETLRERSFLVLAGSSALALTGTAINAALNMHFLTYHARITASDDITVFFATFYVGALAGVLAWARVSSGVEKHHLYAFTTTVHAVVLSSGYWLIGEGRLLGTGQLWALACMSGLVGVFAAGGGVVALSMMADMTALYEQRTGRRRGGVFFGVYSFGQQMAGGVAVLVAGVLVDRFAGLVPAQVEQSAATVERLAMVATLLPAVALAGAGLMALCYRRPRLDLHGVEHGLDASANRPHVPV